MFCLCPMIKTSMESERKEHNEKVASEKPGKNITPIYAVKTFDYHQTCALKVISGNTTSELYK